MTAETSQKGRSNQPAVLIFGFSLYRPANSSFVKIVRQSAAPTSLNKRQAMKIKLAADHLGSMKHIRVDTDKDGVVWLTGTANSQTEIDAAISIARNTEGVKFVWSDLKIQNDR